jgi:dienelactone hydrolase
MKTTRRTAGLTMAWASLVALGGCGTPQPLLGDRYYENVTSSAPLEAKYARSGGHNVAYVEFKSERPAIGAIGAWYPQELEKNNARYPLVMVVNASNTKASMYKPFFQRLASWGFIVVGTEDAQAGTGETATIALDFMLKAPSDSVLRDRIDTKNIGIVGYSQGGAGAIRAVTEYRDSRAFKAMFTGSAAYPALARTMGWTYDVAKVKIPYFMTAGTGSSDDRGVRDLATEFGGVAPLASLVEIYRGMPSNVFKVRARVVGAEHAQMQLRTDGYMTAWMRYQLQADPEAARVFVGARAELLGNSNWQDVEKNQ